MSSAEAVELETSIPFETLDTTLDVLRALSDEAVLRIGKDGIGTTMVDPAAVAMTTIDVRPSAFDITPPGQFALGVNLERFQDFIGKADDDQSIMLAFDTETRKLNIQYANKDLRLAGLDPDSIQDGPTPSDLDFANEFVVDRGTWKDALEMAHFVSDHVTIRVEPDNGQVVVEAVGDNDDILVELDGRDDLLEASLNEETETKLSLDYLVGGNGSKANDGVVNVVPKGGEIGVEIDDTMPIIMSYDYADGHATAETKLAPRVDT